MKKIILVFLSFLVLFFSFEKKGYAAQQVGELYSLSAVLMDGDSGRILYEKNGEEFLSNASTTKILTCILALEKADLQEQVVISEYAASMPDVQLNVRPKEKYCLEDLLYSLMLESHNDVAVAVAEHLAGSCEKFSEMMNQKAKEIGCKNTFFLTPNGLDASKGDKNHGTTAKDLALLMRYCILQSPKKEEFLKITGTAQYTFGDKEGKRTFTCYNRNSFLTMMEGAISGKTGFTSKAGYCYVGALTREEKNYIVALLGCGWPSNKHYKWQDCRKLMEYGLENYHRFLLSLMPPLEQEIFSVEIKNGKNNQGGYSAIGELEVEKIEEQGILLKEGEKIEIKTKKVTKEAPVKKGEVMGSIEYWVEDKLWLSRKLYLKEKIEKIDYQWCLETVIQNIIPGRTK